MWGGSKNNKVPFTGEGDLQFAKTQEKVVQNLEKEQAKMQEQARRDLEAAEMAKKKAEVALKQSLESINKVPTKAASPDEITQFQIKSLFLDLVTSQQARYKELFTKLGPQV